MFSIKFKTFFIRNKGLKKRKKWVAINNYYFYSYDGKNKYKTSGAKRVPNSYINIKTGMEVAASQHRRTANGT